MEFVIRLMFHNANGPVSLSGFKFNDRSTSSLRNKVVGLQKKYNIEAPENNDTDAPKPKKAQPSKKSEQPKKAKGSAPKKRKIEEHVDEDEEEAGQDGEFADVKVEQSEEEAEMKDVEETL
jgi:hypothetical protein